MREGRPTRAVVDLAALRSNYAEAARRAAGRDVIAVVKADAYGHGAVPVARALVQAGCPRLAVLSVAEAEPLRAAGIGAPLLILGGAQDADEAERALSLELRAVIHHRGQREIMVRAARARGAVCDVEVEVDTGMRRMGVPPGEAASFLAAIGEDPHLRLAGVFTHFARADDVDLSSSLEQLDRFRGVLDAARAAGVDTGTVHAANSAGLLAGKELDEALPGAGAVRPGLLLYGACPAPHLSTSLRAVMTLETRVVQVRSVRAGEGVGYSAEFRAQRDTRVATLAIGYADGVPVAAGNHGSVLLRGRRLPVIGRVSMDYVGVDVGACPVEIGDEAVVFGERDGECLPVEEAAAAAGTISYELLVRVGARVPREFVDRDA